MEPMDAYPYLVHVVTADGCRPAAVVRDQYHDGHMIDAYVLDEMPHYTPDVEHSPEGRRGTYHLAREHSLVVADASQGTTLATTQDATQDAAQDGGPTEDAPTISVTVADVMGINRGR